MDLIDRQAAIEAIGEIHSLDYNAQAIKARIEQLPSAQPERKKGKWILINGAAMVYECDQCHERVCCVGKYCMACGAEMEVEE